MVMVLIYTHLEHVTLPVLIVVNVLMFVGIFSRMVPYQALVSSVPEMVKRGSFNAVNSAIQQIGGGVASVLAGHLVSLGSDGRLQGMPIVGYVVIGTTFTTVALVAIIQRSVQRRLALEVAAA
jgi:Na+/melibiose symporter-like transporter